LKIKKPEKERAETFEAIKSSTRMEIGTESLLVLDQDCRDLISAI
jgi:hypothetical protein